MQSDTNAELQKFINQSNEILNSISSATSDSRSSEINSNALNVSIERKMIYASDLRQGTLEAPNRIETTPFLQQKINKYFGVAQMAISGILGLPMLIEFFAMLFNGYLAGSMISGIFISGCMYAFFDGYQKYQLVKQYFRYGYILGNAEYFRISDLARAAVATDKEVLKNIKKMIKMGLLPRTRLDSTETTCMITDRAYEQYVNTVKEQMIAEEKLQTQKDAESECLKAQDAEYSKLPREVVTILEEGKEYITFIRQINDMIPDTDEMSDKLYRLEEIINRIFTQVKKEPSSANELHKLMNYYLPTTKKLLNAYVELDKEPKVGINITQTKTEIDNAIDTINTAFENLLNNLFQDMAWDISSDISVMKTMMAQDGLTTEGQGVSAKVQTAGSAMAQSAESTQTVAQEMKF